MYSCMSWDEHVYLPELPTRSGQHISITPEVPSAPLVTPTAGPVILPCPLSLQISLSRLEFSVSEVIPNAVFSVRLLI